MPFGLRFEIFWLLVYKEQVSDPEVVELAGKRKVMNGQIHSPASNSRRTGQPG